MKKYIGLILGVIGCFLIIIFLSMAVRLHNRPAKIAEIKANLQNTKYLYLGATSYETDLTNPEFTLINLIEDANLVKSVVDSLQNLEIVEKTSTIAGVGYLPIYKLVFYDSSGKIIDSYTFTLPDKSISRIDDKRRLSLNDEAFKMLEILVNQETVQYENFTFNFINQSTSPNNIFNYNENKSVYSLYQINEVKLEKETKNLTDVLRTDPTFLSRLLNGMEFVASLDDGGSNLYRSEEANTPFYVVTCKTLKGDRDIYFGPDEDIVNWCDNSPLNDV